MKNENVGTNSRCHVKTGYASNKGGATVGAVGADCPHWQEAVGANVYFCPH